MHLREKQLWRYSEQCEFTPITNSLPPNGEDQKKQEIDFYQAEQDGKKDKAVEKDKAKKNDKEEDKNNNKDMDLAKYI